MELQKVNLNQLEAAKRNLNFSGENSSFRETNTEEENSDLASTISNGSLSPRQIPLPYSSEDSLDSITPEESPLKEENKPDSESTDECLVQDIHSDEVMSPNPPQGIVYLSNKRQRSRPCFALNSAGSFVVVKKKKRLDL